MIFKSKETLKIIKELTKDSYDEEFNLLIYDEVGSIDFCLKNDDPKITFINEHVMFDEQLRYRFQGYKLEVLCQSELNSLKDYCECYLDSIFNLLGDLTSYNILIKDNIVESSKEDIINRMLISMKQPKELLTFGKKYFPKITSRRNDELITMNFNGLTLLLK